MSSIMVIKALFQHNLFDLIPNILSANILFSLSQSYFRKLHNVSMHCSQNKKCIITNEKRLNNCELHSNIYKNMYTWKIYIFSAQQLRPKEDIDGHAHTRCCHPGTLPFPYASHLPKSSNRTCLLPVEQRGGEGADVGAGADEQQDYTQQTLKVEKSRHGAVTASSGDGGQVFSFPLRRPSSLTPCLYAPSSPSAVPRLPLWQQSRDRKSVV